MKTIQILEESISEDMCNRRCTMLCALTHNCPVPNLDSHDLPIIKKILKGDLEPVGKL